MLQFYEEETSSTLDTDALYSCCSKMANIALCLDAHKQTALHFIAAKIDKVEARNMLDIFSVCLEFLLNLYFVYFKQTDII